MSNLSQEDLEEDELEEEDPVVGYIPPPNSFALPFIPKPKKFELSFVKPAPCKEFLVVGGKCVNVNLNLNVSLTVNLNVNLNVYVYVYVNVNVNVNLNFLIENAQKTLAYADIIYILYYKINGIYCANTVN